MGITADGRQEILTDVGTNEWEIVVFRLGKNYFAINVDKVREIIKFREPTAIPGSHPAVRGVIEVRGEVLPLLDLRIYYGLPCNDERSNIIVAEFNKMKVGFVVDSVDRIYRISATELDDTLTNTEFNSPTVLYIIKRDNRNIMLLDFERIVVDIAPNLAMQVKEAQVLPKRQEKVIMIVEDSPLIREMIEGSLKSGGYKNIIVTKNGKEALDLLKSGTKVDLIITDIEMPQMDGLALTKTIKEDENLKHIPVIVFSSIVSEEISRKCDTVGADEKITKPEIDRLVETVDKLLGLTE